MNKAAALARLRRRRLEMGVGVHWRRSTTERDRALALIAHVYCLHARTAGVRLDPADLITMHGGLSGPKVRRLSPDVCTEISLPFLRSAFKALLKADEEIDSYARCIEGLLVINGRRG